MDEKDVLEMKYTDVYFCIDCSKMFDGKKELIKFNDIIDCSFCSKKINRNVFVTEMNRLCLYQIKRADIEQIRLSIIRSLKNDYKLLFMFYKNSKYLEIGNFENELRDIFNKSLSECYNNHLLKFENGAEK